jgi:hypothetical protein
VGGYEAGSDTDAAGAAHGPVSQAVEVISSQVGTMAIASKVMPEAAKQVHKEASDSCLFLAEVFLRAPSSALPVPPQKRHKNCPRSVLAEPSRHSARQAAIKSVVLVSQRASTRLIRQLDLVGPSTPVGEAEIKQLAELFWGSLASQTIEAIRAATCLADDQITRAVAAMAANEAAAQAEATAA